MTSVVVMHRLLSSWGFSESTEFKRRLSLSKPQLLPECLLRLTCKVIKPLPSRQEKLLKSLNSQDC